MKPNKNGILLNFIYCLLQGTNGHQLTAMAISNKKQQLINFLQQEKG